MHVLLYAVVPPSPQQGTMEWLAMKPAAVRHSLYYLRVVLIESDRLAVRSLSAGGRLLLVGGAHDADDDVCCLLVRLLVVGGRFNCKPHATSRNEQSRIPYY